MENAQKTILRIKTTQNVDGNIVNGGKSIPNIRPDATDTAMKSVGESLSSLMDYDTVTLHRIDEKPLA